jgi:hypothetical protein
MHGMNNFKTFLGGSRGNKLHVAHIHIEGIAKFQLEVSENKVVSFSPSKLTDPLKSIHEPLIRDPWTIG